VACVVAGAFGLGPFDQCLISNVLAPHSSRPGRSLRIPKLFARIQLAQLALWSAISAKWKLSPPFWLTLVAVHLLVGCIVVHAPLTCYFCIV
jgi:hypothetical protein